MASAVVSYYYKYRQWVNCQGGGYLEDYNLAIAPVSATAAPTPQVLQVLYNIVNYRGILLENNSKIANGVLSIETIVSMNPPEGYQVPHQAAGYPTPMNDPTSNALEKVPAAALDPQQCMAFKFTASNYQSTEYHWLRSIRSTWVNQFPTLGPAIQAYINANGSTNYQNAGFLTLSANPAYAIGYFMLYLRDNTSFIQPLKSGGNNYNYNFNQISFLQALPGLPNTYCPTLIGLARKKVGSGWPKIHGKMQSFGTHG